MAEMAYLCHRTHAQAPRTHHHPPMTQKAKPVSPDNAPRRNTVSITLSDRELAAIDEYCEIFGGRSRAAVVREAAIRFVRAKLIDRHTSLFLEEVDLPESRQPKPRMACEPTPSLFDFLDDEENPDSK